MDQNDNPEKKRKPRKRKSKKKPLSDDDLKLDISSLSAFFAQASPEEAKYDKDIRAVRANIGEFLSSYMLLGYTIDGKPVSITHGNNQRDMDALSTSLHKYIFDNCLRPPGGFPPSNYE